MFEKEKCNQWNSLEHLSLFQEEEKIRRYNKREKYLTLLNFYCIEKNLITKN